MAFAPPLWQEDQMPTEDRKLPSTLSDWHQNALFLDFDGTLAPIVPRPEDAAASADTCRAVARIAELADGAVAILSGRDLVDLDRRLTPLVLPAAGSHGAVRRDATGKLHRTEIATDDLAKAVTLLEQFAVPRDLLVEHKTGAVTVHYRNRPEQAEPARKLVDAITADAPALRAIHGNMVSEIATCSANKGHALRDFMDEPPFAGRVPVMVGDDTTDEDAFRVAEALGGAGLKIGGGETVATYRLSEIGDFLDWLHRSAAP